MSQQDAWSEPQRSEIKPKEAIRYGKNAQKRAFERIDRYAPIHMDMLHRLIVVAEFAISFAVLAIALAACGCVLAFAATNPIAVVS